MVRTVLTLVLAVLFSPSVRAQEKFAIKIKNEAQGDIIQTTQTDIEKGKSSVTIMGRTQTEDLDSTSSATFKSVIIEREPDKRVAKMKRIYKKAEATKEGNKLELSLVGKEVLIVRDGKKMQFTAAGKEFAGDDAAFLQMEFKGKGSLERESKIEDLILPKQLVSVNDAWKIDMGVVAKHFSKETPFTADAAKSSGTGKLLKAYKKDGMQYGAFEVEMTMAVTKFAAGPMVIDLNPVSNVKITIRYDGCIDGSSGAGTMDIALQMKMSGARKTDGMEAKLDVNMNKKTSTAREDLTGKK